MKAQFLLPAIFILLIVSAKILSWGDAGKKMRNPLYFLTIIMLIFGILKMYFLTDGLSAALMEQGVGNLVSFPKFP